MVTRVKPHPFFEVDGQTLHVTVPVRFETAVLGGPIDVPVLDGVVQMHLPENAPEDVRFRIRGRGLPLGATGTGTTSASGDGSTRGDVMVRVSVVLPSGLSSAQKDALRAARDILEPDANYPGVATFKKAIDVRG